MRRENIIVTIAAMMLTSLVTGVQADTVEFKSGATTSGKVTVGSEFVHIRNENGTLKVSRDRISTITRSENFSEIENEGRKAQSRKVRRGPVKGYSNDLRDILLFTADRKPAMPPVMDRSNTDDNKEVWAQAGTGDNGFGWNFDDEEEDGETARGFGPTPMPSFSERGRNLGLIISGSVRPGSWAEPPVIVVGGGR